MNKVDLRRLVKIEDVIKEFVELTQKGRNYISDCPFCDSHASMIISPAHRYFKCFRCDRKGDVVAFVMQKLGMDETKAMKYLKKKYLTS